MNRLDYYDIMPAGAEAYLSHYGWHFSKAMCEWAVSMMEDRAGNRLVMKSKEQVEAILKAHGIELENDYGYDKVYVMHMGLADYVGSSIIDEAHLAKYVKDVLDDPDGYEGVAFTRFFADCNGKGIPIIWADMI